MAASSSRCSVTAASTGAGMSEAPALLRWLTRAQPGVSRRARGTSILGFTVDTTKGTVSGPFELRPLFHEVLRRRHNPELGGEVGGRSPLELLGGYPAAVGCGQVERVRRVEDECELVPEGGGHAGGRLAAEVRLDPAHRDAGEAPLAEPAVEVRRAEERGV